MIIKDTLDLTRYKTEHERNRFFERWVKHHGLPTLKDGCIMCAELTCLDNCLGITDVRVKKMYG